MFLCHLSVCTSLIITRFFYRTDIDEGRVRVGIIFFNAFSRVTIGLNNKYNYEQLISNFGFDSTVIYSLLLTFLKSGNASAIMVVNRLHLIRIDGWLETRKVQAHFSTGTFTAKFIFSLVA